MMDLATLSKMRSFEDILNHQTFLTCYGTFDVVAN